MRPRQSWVNASPIMIKTTAIREDDIDRLRREFLRPEFVAHRLGRPGQWQGDAISKLGLTGPVEPKTFANLLDGRTPEGESLLRPSPGQSPRILGWRLTLTAEAPASVLWALSPPVIRGRLQSAHANAVRSAVADFERQLNGRPWFDTPSAPVRSSTLVAKFHSGASPKQTPRLETSIILFNLVLETGRENRPYAPQQLAGQGRRIDASYGRAFQSETSRSIGAHARIPDDLVARFEAHPPGSGQPGGSSQTRPVPSQELFGKWQEQAREWGWGTERTTELIHQSRSRASLSNLLEDARTLGRAWAIAVQVPTHSPLRVGEVLASSQGQTRTAASPSRDQDEGMSQ